MAHHLVAQSLGDWCNSSRNVIVVRESIDVLVKIASGLRRAADRKGMDFGPLEAIEVIVTDGRKRLAQLY